ncbi:response regulator transcription factor [Terrilactibacillus laevilacticus]|uniref:Heme response regulator HssR n=1 Tax=Terrilactibacillus laevilacticus TaxID=1380157 RepID=A0ABW5PPA7_9BACI|nr:response regulator transcription factor [Terrilactibacillus laevilacticus]
MNEVIGLVVDDDPNIRELAGLFLKKEGFTIIEAANGREALNCFEKQPIDFVILDVMMPDTDGFEACQEIRHYYGDDLPILMLTAKGETVHKIKGFQLGADDYLVKPFDPLELVARIKALLKRYHILTSQIIQLGQVKIDLHSHQVKINDRFIQIPLKEFELLSKLASSPGKTFSREQLIEEVWGFDYEGDERTVDVHVKRLRERFPKEDYPFWITTVRGLGYRFEVAE